MDDSAHKYPANKMAEFYSVKNEMTVRAALIVSLNNGKMVRMNWNVQTRACDELMKLCHDLKEFLVLHDFNFLTHAIKA